MSVLDELVKKAYTDPEVLQYLYEAHYYQYEKVAKKIIAEHFKRCREEVCTTSG
tara:strand:+ start:99 stop:260 length:162 start_codon:yes stop_codon:yes gene_type:complete